MAKSAREEEAWEMAETYLQHYIPSPPDIPEYFGHAFAGPDMKLVSVSLPPTPPVTGETSGSSPRQQQQQHNVPVAVTVRARIPPGFANRVGNLHGGAAATMFDNLNSAAIFVWAMFCAGDEEMSARWMTTGVSRSLNVSYVRPVVVGEEVDVLNEVVAVGQNLTLVRGVMTRVRDGKLICTCEHHKVSVRPGGSKL